MCGVFARGRRRRRRREVVLDVWRQRAAGQYRVACLVDQRYDVLAPVLVGHFRRTLGRHVEPNVVETFHRRADDTAAATTARQNKSSADPVSVQ